MAPRRPWSIGCRAAVACIGRRYRHRGASRLARGRIPAPGCRGRSPQHIRQRLARPAAVAPLASTLRSAGKSTKATSRGATGRTRCSVTVQSNAEEKIRGHSPGRSPRVEGTLVGAPPARPRVTDRLARRLIEERSRDLGGLLFRHPEPPPARQPSTRPSSDHGFEFHVAAHSPPRRGAARGPSRRIPEASNRRRF